MSHTPTLKPFSGTRRRKKELRFAVCDIEAHQWANFKVMGYYDGEEYHEFRSLLEFVEFCFEYAYENGITDIYAHFGSIYDFMFIMECALEYGYLVKDMIPRGSGLLCMTIYHPDNPKRQITFRDSAGLLPFGLANITKSFGVKNAKGEFDFTTWDGKITKKLLEYLRDDCIGLHQSLTAFFNWPLIKKAGSAHTMASQAMRVFRLFMTQELKKPPEAVDEFVRKSYFGGRTEIFIPEFKDPKKELNYYDVNSLYPTVMRDNRYPGNFAGWTEDYCGEVMGFYEAKVRVPDSLHIPPLPRMQQLGFSEKLIFPTGEFEGIFSTIELEYAKSLGVEILETGKGAIFEDAGFLFRDYIQKLYDMRLEAKKKKDGVGDVLCKLLMNSTYGRFGLNCEKQTVVWDDGRVEASPLCELNIGGFTHRLMTKDVHLDQTFTNVAIAAWVTSHSRILMHKIFMKSPKEIYYTDTDSLFSTKKFGTGDALGELKKENDEPIEHAIFLLPKTYAFKTNDGAVKKAMKGFNSRKIDKFTMDDFNLALEGDLRTMSVIHDEKLATMKTAMKRFGKIVSVLPKQEKQLRSQYDKRIIYREKGTVLTRPHKIVDGTLQ